MKKLYILLALLLTGFCQQALGQKLILDTGWVQPPPDTIEFATSVKVQYRILNTDTVDYFGRINSWIKTGKNKKAYIFDSITTTVPKKGSKIIDAYITPLDTNYFQIKSNNIVVVWPTGTGTVITVIDSLIDTFYVKEKSPPKPVLSFNGSVKGFPDSALYGSKINITYTIKNTSSTTFNDSIFTWMKTGGAITKIGATKVIINVSDSVTIQAGFDVKTPIFQEKTTPIVVIWPTGTGTTINLSDSARNSLYIIELPKPELDSLGIYGLRDTLKYGSEINVYYKLLNKSSTPYNDSIFTWMKTDLDATPLRIGATKVKITDSATIMAKFNVLAPYFQENVKSIVVIWPTGTGTISFKLKDSIKKTILIEEKVSIREINSGLNYVRFYPNPAKHFLHFAYMQPNRKITRVYITDMLGRKQELFISEENNIDISRLQKGIFILTVEFNNKKSTSYRLVKSE